MTQTPISIFKFLPVLHCRSDLTISEGLQKTVETLRDLCRRDEEAITLLGQVLAGNLNGEGAVIFETASIGALRNAEGFLTYYDV